MLVAPGSDENDRAWRDLATGGAPVVILDRDVPGEGDTPWPAVLVDHREGARTATRYLIGLGHRRIALLTPGARMRPGRERIAGFKAAFAEADIDPEGALICLQASSMDFARGDALELLRRDRRPTAVIALGTRILAGALRAAQDFGFRAARPVGDRRRRHRSRRRAFTGDHGLALEPGGCRPGGGRTVAATAAGHGGGARARCCRSISCCANPVGRRRRRNQEPVWQLVEGGLGGIARHGTSARLPRRRRRATPNGRASRSA